MRSVCYVRKWTPKCLRRVETWPFESKAHNAALGDFYDVNERYSLLTNVFVDFGRLRQTYETLNYITLNAL